MSDLNLFSSAPNQSGHRLGGAVARQVKRESDVVAAHVEVAALQEAGHAFLASTALHNASVLVAQAEAAMRVAPAGRDIYAQILEGYAIGVMRRQQRHL